MVNEEIALITGTSVCLTNTITQSNEVMQYINLSITILVGIVTIAYTIFKWYKKAKEDGQITKDEVEELIENVGDSIEDLTNKREED